LQRAGEQRARGSFGFWLYMVATVLVLLLATASAIWYYKRSKPEPEGFGGNGHGRARAAVSAASARPKRARAARASRSSFTEASSCTGLAESTGASAEELPARHGQAPWPPAQMPLCPLLIVPEGTRLACVVQNDVCRKKQDLSFNIRGMQSRGGAALFQMRVSEHGSLSPGIYVETLGGKEQLAFLSTEDLWQGSARPVLSISRPWGEVYGSIQKSESGEYVVQRGKSGVMWVFSGDFLRHSVQVVTTSGHAVASVCPGSSEEYQVYGQACTDAGLLILGLLAIDKCEADPGAAVGC